MKTVSAAVSGESQRLPAGNGFLNRVRRFDSCGAPIPPLTYGDLQAANSSSNRIEGLRRHHVQNPWHQELIVDTDSLILQGSRARGQRCPPGVRPLQLRRELHAPTQMSAFPSSQITPTS